MGTTPCASWCRSVLVLTFSLTLTLSVAEPAQAEPDSAPTSVAALVAEVAEANQKLQEVGARVQVVQTVTEVEHGVGGLVLQHPPQVAQAAMDVGND